METISLHKHNIDQIMINALKDGVFPGGVLLWADRKDIKYHKGFGVTDLRLRVPVTVDTVFDLASLTKPLATALAVADLITQGLLAVDMPLDAVLPSSRGTDKAFITIDMLLRHTAGLPAHRPYFSRIYPPVPGKAPRSNLRRLVMEEPLEHIPGTREVYSDLGYILLAWVVEYLSGMRLDQFVTERIYRPLGIDRLFFNDLCSEQKDRKRSEPSIQFASTWDCPWRKKVVQGEVEDENAWAAGGIEGHAGLFGTAVCVHCLCCEIMSALDGKNAKVLSPAVLQMFAKKITGMSRAAGFDTPSIQGSSAGSLFSRNSLGHLGFTGTSFWMDPDSGLIVILLSNRVHPSRENIKIKKFRPLIHDMIASVFKANITAVKHF